jgi:hypothetical protein
VCVCVCVCVCVWRCVQSGQVCCCLGVEKERYKVVKACVCVGGYDWRGEKLSSVLTGLAVRSGVGVVSVSGAPVVCARGVTIAAWCGILGVNDTALLQVAGMLLIVMT